jgi:DNA-binding NarL/FixJ family response regulator
MTLGSGIGDSHPSDVEIILNAARWRRLRTGAMIWTMGAGAEELIAEGRGALRAGDARRAREAFEAARADDDSGDERAEILDGLARVAYLELDFQQAITLYERAYGRYRAQGDRVGAVTVARTLAGLYGTIIGDWAVMNGWLSRAQTVMGGDAEPREQGWVALTRGMFAPDRAHKNELFDVALTTARAARDVDLEVATLAYLGASLVHAGRFDDGMTMLDEALAAVAGGEIDDFFLFEEVFCQLFSACEYAHDVTRADQWISVGNAIAARQQLPAVSGFCRTHYAGVLTAAGRWPEAATALSGAIDDWSTAQRSQLRIGALARLADLRIRQGRVEEAERLLGAIDLAHCSEAARPWAAVHFARGEFARAGAVLEAALDEVGRTQPGAAPLFELLVQVELAAQHIDLAGAAAAELEALAASTDTDYVCAAAALARARVCRARGDADAERHLRAALTAFASARMPIEIATSRLELATSLGTTAPEVAIAEARAALDTFRRSEASRLEHEAVAVLRALGVREAEVTRTGGDLTKRESEVLTLIGDGLSNPEIAARLFVSRKTVEFHVSNVLAKLGFRSRAEAAAYVTRSRTETGVGS